ncbi:hypothetical protein ACLOJK_029654, partial [Asimina triloba]
LHFQGFISQSHLEGIDSHIEIEIFNPKVSTYGTTYWILPSTSAFRSTNFMAKSSVNAHINVNVKNVKAAMARVLGIEYFGPSHK